MTASDAHPARHPLPVLAVIGLDSPMATARRPPGRGGPLQFPSSPSERSTPHTPESPSRLHLQGLHRFRGLRPDFPGSALSVPRPKAGPLTTRQASLYAADRSVASPRGAFDAGLRPDPFPDRAASLLPGLLAATRTGLSPAGDDELTNSKIRCYVTVSPAALLGPRKPQVSASSSSDSAVERRPGHWPQSRRMPEARSTARLASPLPVARHPRLGYLAGLDEGEIPTICRGRISALLPLSSRQLGLWPLMGVLAGARERAARPGPWM